MIERGARSRGSTLLYGGWCPVAGWCPDMHCMHASMSPLTSMQAWAHQACTEQDDFDDDDFTDEMLANLDSIVAQHQHRQQVKAAVCLPNRRASYHACCSAYACPDRFAAAQHQPGPGAPWVLWSAPAGLSPRVCPTLAGSSTTSLTLPRPQLEPPAADQPPQQHPSGSSAFA